MRIEVHPLDATRRDDFHSLHSERNEHGWCRCVAWWVESFDDWGERTAEQNLALREAVMDRGNWDGYLLYADSEPAAWCQCCPLTWLEHLERRHELPADPDAWVLGCLFVAPAFRRRGLARRLLEGVVRDLCRRGAPTLLAVPRRGDELEDGELWTGPEALVRDLGFELARDDERLPVYRLDLAAASEGE